MAAKKNLRTIPAFVTSHLRKISQHDIIAATSRVYSAQQLQAGALGHLGVTLRAGQLILPEPVVPPVKSGKYSSRNVNGREIVRRDLKKETLYNYIDSPNWGDASNGYHTVALPYERYPREFETPALIRINVTCPKPAEGAENYLLVFALDRVLDRQKKSFNDELLFCLNILQENVGDCGVQPSGATAEDYLRTLKVAWELLPAGTREEAVARVFRGRVPSAEERAAVEERYDFLMSLHPQNLVYGTSGLQRYFGGLLRDDLVIFENIEYGNAIYVMFDTWRELSQRSRTELMSGRYGRNFERVQHTQGWKGQVRTIVDQKLKPKS